MANSLTDLAADLYVSADIVARELTGIIPSITINRGGSERVAKGDPIRSFFTQSQPSVDIAESMTIPEGVDQVIDNKTLTISKSKSIQIPWTGEDIVHVNNGSGFVPIRTDQITQAMRSLANEIEADLAIEAYQNASRAIGTAGTTPFLTDFNDTAQLRKLLVDNGVPNDGQWTIAMDTAAGANMRSLPQLQKANEAGGAELLRQGTLLNLNGFMLKESAQIASHTQGTGTGYLTDDASLEAGDDLITVDTGTGTIVKGDVLGFAADTDNAYVVNTALSGSTLNIGEPGLIVDIADSNAITVGDDYVANLAFHRSAIELAMRAPAVPTDGDAAVDSMLIADPKSGLLFEIRLYKGYRKQMIEVAAAWGFKAWLPKYIAVLMG